MTIRERVQQSYLHIRKEVNPIQFNDTDINLKIPLMIKILWWFPVALNLNFVGVIVVNIVLVLMAKYIEIIS